MAKSISRCHRNVTETGRLPAPVIELFAKGYLAVDFFIILSRFALVRAMSSRS